MSKFILLYTGKPTPSPDLPDEQAAAILNSWQQWGQRIGDALVDTGAPFIGGKEIVANGLAADPLPMNGYAIIQAESMAQALEITKTHPYLSDKQSRLSIAVFELMTEPLETDVDVDTQAQTQAVSPPIEPQSQPTPPPPGTLPPPAEEEAVPPSAPGELTIPHEAPGTEEQPPLPPTPPAPGQPSI
jgi:hypothetical protein